MSTRMAKIVAFLMLSVSTCAYAQNAVEVDQPWLKAPDDQRAWVYITNDYKNTIQLTMWTKRGAQVGDSWALAPGQSGYLAAGRQKVTASSEYVIKVGTDPGEVPVAAVSERHGKTWNVSVRKIWLATHQVIAQPGAVQ